MRSEETLARQEEPTAGTLSAMDCSFLIDHHHPPWLTSRGSFSLWLSGWLAVVSRFATNTASSTCHI